MGESLLGCQWSVKASAVEHPFSQYGQAIIEKFSLLRIIALFERAYFFLLLIPVSITINVSLFSTRLLIASAETNIK